MFPSIEIESFFDNIKKDVWLSEELLPVAQLCEEWILSFEPAATGFTDALAQVSQDRMWFALGMALSIPSEKTGEIFAKHCDYMLDRSDDIAAFVTMISKHSADGVGIDVLKAFSFLPSRQLYETARQCYDTELHDVRSHAIAWDNLEVFAWSLPAPLKNLAGEETRIRKTAFQALSGFAVDTDSRIYRQLIRTPEDRLDLFRLQVERLFNQRNRYSYQRYWERPTDFSLPTLLPGHQSRLEPQPPLLVNDFFLEKGLSEGIKADRHHVISTFYQLAEENYRSLNDFSVHHKITRAVMDSGITPESMISAVFYGWDEAGPTLQLNEAISALADLGPHNQEFYSSIFTRYLEQFTQDQVLAHCESEAAFAALYKLTRDKTYLEAGGNVARDKCFEGDLGL